jgi:hypothetical protein
VLAADAVNPQLSPGWLDYAQHVGFATDPTRIRSPQDKPRVERAVQYVRGNFWAAESFTDLADAQNRVEIWCREKAGMRVHGTTARRPAEMFAELEAGYLLPLPEPYDQPVFTRLKVHRDYHVEVARALYSVPSICSARAWTPGSTASAGPFLVFAPSSRHKEGDDQQNPGQVSETAMGLHRAHPEVVLGGVEAGRVVVPIQPLAAPPPPRQEHRRPEGAGRKEHHHRGPAPPRIPAGCEMDDHQDHAEDPDRRMTQDLDTPEMGGAGGAAMAEPCPQQEGADEDRRYSSDQGSRADHANDRTTLVVCFN